MFSEPTNQFQFELPLGWAYIPEQSHLTTLRFAYWNHMTPWKEARETLIVQSSPTLAPYYATLEEWSNTLLDYSELLGLPFDLKQYQLFQYKSGPGALADVHEVEPIIHRRVLIVRGKYLDIVLAHLVKEPSTGNALSDLLSTLGQSLIVPSNLFEPKPLIAQEIIDSLGEILGFAEGNSSDKQREKIDLLQNEIQKSLAYYIATSQQSAAIDSSIMLLELLLERAKAKTDLLLLRDAEYFALRLLNSLHQIGKSVPQDAWPDEFRTSWQRANNAIQETLHEAKMLQLLKIGWSRYEAGVSASNITTASLALSRVSTLADEARQFDVSKQYHTVRSHQEIVIFDLFMLISNPWATFSIGPNIAKMLSIPDQGSVELQYSILRHALLNDLLAGLSALFVSLIYIGDLLALAGTSEALVLATKALGRTQDLVPASILNIPKNYSTLLASHLLQKAEVQIGIGAESNLGEAKEALDEAATLLGNPPLENQFRPESNLTKADHLYIRETPVEALEVIERGLQVSSLNEEDDRLEVARLLFLQLRYYISTNQKEKALELLSSVHRAPSVNINSLNYMHFVDCSLQALVEIDLGQIEAAKKTLQKALHQAIKAGLFNEEVVYILRKASNLYIRTDFLLSLDLNLAAGSVVDVIRSTIWKSTLRIDFDDARERRKLYRDIVTQTMAHQMDLVPSDNNRTTNLFVRYEELHKEVSKLVIARIAIVAADRYRARTLNEILAKPLWSSKDVVTNAPLLQEEAIDISERSEIKEAINRLDILKTYESSQEAFLVYAHEILSIADIIQRQQGAILLSTNQVEELITELRVPTLIIQPTNYRVALLLIRPFNRIETVFSPLPLSELLQLIDMAQDHFHVSSSSRGGKLSPDSKQASTSFEIQQNLWNALIEPINDFMRTDEPLIIVPYREFTLIPFALLTDSKGRMLIEQHALSIVPSLAILWMLRKRGTWIRSHPEKAYIVGDPAFAPKYTAMGLPRLQAARAEAEMVKRKLKAFPMKSEDIILRLDRNAHEESYRSEAQGCDFLHLACHATLKTPAYESCLYLAPYNSFDGLLQATEISEVKLNDALVFLAACETGVGRATVDGVIGLGRAFLEAGARAVILSLWKVQNEVTVVLCKHFYTALFRRRNRLNVSEALRYAMLRTYRDLQEQRILQDDETPLTSNPANWSPFFILGDGSSIMYSHSS